MAIRITKKSRETNGLLADIPDRLLQPVIRIDPSASRTQREYQAFESWYEYVRDLQVHAKGQVQPVMEALGTTLADFLDLARTLPEDREACL